MLRILDPEVISYEKAILQELADFGIEHRNPETAYGWNYVLDHTWLTKELDIYLVGRQKNELLMLDVGCGRSMYHDFLEARLGIEIIGIDRPAGHAHVGEMRNVDYCEDFLNLEAFEDNAVDIILWLSSIEHNRPHRIRQLYQKSMRLLREGGLFLATLAVTENTEWFEESEQVNLSLNDCMKIFDEKTSRGDFKAIREKYRQNMLFLRDKYRLRYGRFGGDDPGFITAGVKRTKWSTQWTSSSVMARSASKQTNMRMLFYIEPMLTLDQPYLHKHWWHFTQRMLTTLESDTTGSHSFRFIMSDPVRTQVSETHTSGKYIIATITQEALLRKFNFDYYSASLAWYRKTYSQEQLDYSAQLIRDTLGDWSPDIVVSFSPVPFIQKAFPRALVLHHEYGITSRPPFPESFYFDPEGFYKDSYLIRHAAEIRMAPIQASERMSLERYRKGFVDLIEARNPFSQFLESIKHKFGHLVLVPLQVSRTYWFDGNSDFTSQFQFIQYVLSRIPDSIGVVFSPHPDYPALTPEVVSYLRATYPHFIYSPELETIRSASQYLIGHVDAVISVGSMVGLQALIWKKKIIAIGTGQVRLAADAENLDNIEELLEAAPLDRDNILLWLLTRYCIPIDYLYDPDWFTAFLGRSLNLHRQGQGYDDLFIPIDDINRLIDRLLDSAVPEIPVRNTVTEGVALRSLLTELDREVQELRKKTDRTKDLEQQLTYLQLESESLRKREQSSVHEVEQLREHIDSLNSELDGYRTGILSSAFRWARDWINRHLPQDSRRGHVARVLAKWFLILVSEGPWSLRRKAS